MVVDRQGKRGKIIFIVAFCLLFLLNGCQSQKGLKKSSNDVLQYNIVGIAMALDFGPDGRLWRLLPSSDAVYVDYSNDQGMTFSDPHRVNPHDQKINVWAENPPAIQVSQSGRIHVLYYADADQKATTFYSYSDDNGVNFSTPKTVSDHAQTALHYMDEMLVDEQDKVYLFWHDTRHAQHDSQLGAGVLSLYYSVSEKDSQTFANHKLTGAVCSCCRTATDMAPDARPAILARMVFTGGVRDHALMKMQSDGSWSTARRFLRDEWQIEACPEHGPALSIDQQGRSHMAWFTLGSRRKGIYYAYSDDYGNSASTAIALGNQQRLPSHPDVIAAGDRVVLVWQEFDGVQTSVVSKQSKDRGETWSTAKQVLTSSNKTAYPELIRHGAAVYLSWLTKNEGHKFINIPQ